jgi:hypothetical protein
MRKIVAALLAWLIGVCTAIAQIGGGQFPPGTARAGPAIGSAAPPSRMLVSTDTSPAATWFESAYCNTIGYLIVRLTGVWTCPGTIAADPVWWGADPSGAGDSAGAFNSALAATPLIQFPAGTFKFRSRITFTLSSRLKAVKITGAGPDITTLVFLSGDGITINYGSGNNAAYVGDLTCVTDSTGSGTCLTLTASAPLNSEGIQAPSLIQNFNCRGSDGYGVSFFWSICVLVHNVSDVNFINDYMTGTNGLPYARGNVPSYHGVGVRLDGSAETPVIYNFDNVQLNQLEFGIVYGSYIQGVTVVNSNFTANNIGIYSPPGDAGFPGQLVVTNSQFGTKVNGSGIHLNSCLDSVLIQGSAFVVESVVDEGTGNGIVLQCYDRTTITGNELEAPSNGNGIVIGPTPQDAHPATIITGNILYNFTKAIWLQPGSAATTINGNRFMFNGTAILNQSTDTTNIIANNAGYNPVGVTAAANVGASPAVITAGPSPETHYLNQSATGTATIKKPGTANAGACNGNTIATLANTSTYYPIELGPNESYCVTWSTTPPTYTKDVH